MPDRPLFIDSKNGNVRLPNGGVISPDLSLDAFETHPSFTESRTISSGVPWWGYAFSGGRIDDKALLVSVQFYDQLLLSIDLTVSHYPPEQKDLSEKVEVETKVYHDRLLERLLGRPDRTIVSPMGSPDRYPILDRFLEWTFPWGTVSSVFDGRSCSSFMMVRYGNRWEEAHRLDKERRKIPT